MCVVIFLLCLAVFDLFVGVSNDAVNFLNNAIGAKASSFRTVLFIASAGVIIGAVMSNGMMDVARHGVMNPSNYTFEEIMVIFLAVMVSDVIILDIFNSFGMPTSTTVSLVFELLGGTFALATLKIINSGGDLVYGELLNADKALSMIIAIFVSVAIAFISGIIVQWLARLIFTFNYKKHGRYAIALFGGVAFTSLSYFIFLKGLGKSQIMSSQVQTWVDEHMAVLLCCTFVASVAVMEVLHLMRVNIFKFIVLMGTFALAMAFAGNDLVNFIGVPLAGLDSYNDYLANGAGASPSTYFMISLNENAHTPTLYLLGAAVIMICAIVTSSKARDVIKTSVNLARQDDGDEMFGTTRTARSIVRAVQNVGDVIARLSPARLRQWVDNRFNQQDNCMPEDAAFDIVRAAVNLVLASMLITIGTNYKLPLSTTYVTFMVAMGSSLADRAWGRENAVFRVTGVLSVIGGWFITAGAAFAVCGIITLIMFAGGLGVQIIFMLAIPVIIFRSNCRRSDKDKERDNDMFRLMMRTSDPEIMWDLLRKHVSRTQSFVTRLTTEQFNNIIDGLEHERPSRLRRAMKEIRDEKEALKKYRRQELLTLRRLPADMTIERNTWFHLGINSSEQYLYCLLRMLEPIKEHVDSNFNPLPLSYIDEFRPIREEINDLMRQTESLISASRFDNYRTILANADKCKDLLSVVRKRHIDRIQQNSDKNNLKVSLVYLNILQESQQLLSIMRHQLRAAKKFMDK